MASQKIRRQCGLWDSSISPISLARGITFSDVAWDKNGALLWREGRSDRGVIVVQKFSEQAPRDLNSELSVRARVGYGGGDFTPGLGYVYFADADSSALYRQPVDHGKASQITPAFGQSASPAVSPQGKWIVFVHTYQGEDHLAIVPADGKQWPRKLVSGDDFYMQPVWHPAGDRLAWIAWNHPAMPWDGTLLRMGQIDLSQELPILKEVRIITGDENTSIFQPEFSPDGRYLAYVSDASGWWHIYLYELDSGRHRQLTTGPADHGTPAWVQGLRTYGFDIDGKHIFFIRNQQGFASLWQLEIDSGQQQPLALDEAYTWLEQIAVSPDGDRLALLASGGATPPRVITYSFTQGVRIHQRATSEELTPQDYAPTQPINWQGMDGGLVYGLYYPPHNPNYEAVGKPPLIVHIHGGPTSQRRASFNGQAQFFTSRGYAYLEVNYRGSTGYGRPYWEALKGNWGLYDVQDAVSGARHLVNQGLVDGDRLVIMGGSAGGFTVLQALVDYPGFFKAGLCLYGVTNQFTLIAETHKFEAHYTDSLLGPLPEAAELCWSRSPIFHAEKIQDPIAIFQGEEDQVVPRSQSDEIVASLRRRGIPHEYHLYPGEGHGFRKTETIEHFYKAVEKFLKQYVIYA